MNTSRPRVRRAVLLAVVVAVAGGCFPPFANALLPSDSQPPALTVDVKPRRVAGTGRVFVPYVGVMSERRASSRTVQDVVRGLREGQLQAQGDGAEQLLSEWSDRVLTDRRERFAYEDELNAKQDDLDAARERAKTAERREALRDEEVRRLQERLDELETRVASADPQPSPVPTFVSDAPPATPKPQPEP